MELNKALAASKSGTARAMQGGKMFTCQSGVIKHFREVYMHMAAGSRPKDLGFSVSVQIGELPPFHHELIDEMWEVEECIRVNFQVTGLSWEPYEIEEA